MKDSTWLENLQSFTIGPQYFFGEQFRKNFMIHDLFRIQERSYVEKNLH